MNDCGGNDGLRCSALLQFTNTELWRFLCPACHIPSWAHWQENRGSFFGPIHQSRSLNLIIDLTIYIGNLRKNVKNL